MKKIYLFLSVLLLTINAEAQIISFPDINFKNKVIADGVDTNNDGEIQISEAEAVTELDVFSFASDPNKITDMEGLQYFINLTYLDCAGNLITELDLTPLTELQQVWCYINQLTSLDLTGLENLEFITAFNNNLSSLDISTLTNLRSLNIGDNQIESLDLLALSNVEYIVAYENELEVLNVNHFDNLTDLSFDNNNVSEIDLSGMTNLFYLGASQNPLTELDASETSAFYILCDFCAELTYVNAQNGVISLADPDLLDFGFLFNETTSLELICMDPGEETALFYSGYDPAITNVTIQPNCALSIDDFVFKNVFIHPNPVKDNFNISETENIESYDLTTISGHTIMRSRHLDKLKEFVPNLSSGVYLLGMNSYTGERQVVKIVKE